MHGLGTLVNCATIIIGSAIGLLIHSGLSKRFEDTIFSAIGLAVMFIGLGGTLSQLLIFENGSLNTRYTMMMVLSLVIGSVLGELVDVEERLVNLGDRIKKRTPKKFTGNNFVDGFVTASMLFCVGAMSIVGALEDGLNSNYSILFAKSVLDGISAILLSASLGFGVALSVFPLLIYQGGITLLSQFLQPILTDMLIGQISCIGSILIFAIGINLIFGKKIKVGNLLPAILFPIIFALIKLLFPDIKL